jgi:hypothetical protein
MCFQGYYGTKCESHNIPSKQNPQGGEGADHQLRFSSFINPPVLASRHRFYP